MEVVGRPLERLAIFHTDTLPALRRYSRDWLDGRTGADPGWRPHGSRPPASSAKPVATAAAAPDRGAWYWNFWPSPASYARCTEDPHGHADSTKRCAYAQHRRKGRRGGA